MKKKEQDALQLALDVAVENLREVKENRKSKMSVDLPVIAEKRRAGNLICRAVRFGGLNRGEQIANKSLERIAKAYKKAVKKYHA